MWNGWNQPPEPFLTSQISDAPGTSLQSGAPNLLLTTSFHVLPFTVQLPFVRTSSNLWSGAPARSCRPMISVFVLRTAGSEAGSGTPLFGRSTSNRRMSRVNT